MDNQTSTLAQTVLDMTVGAIEVAKIGHAAVLAELVAGGLTKEEANTVVNGVIEVRLGKEARKPSIQQLRADGLKIKEIAEKIGVSTATVNRDLGNVSGDTKPKPSPVHGDLGNVSGDTKPKPPKASSTTDPRVTEFFNYLRTLDAARDGARLKRVDDSLHEFFRKNLISCEHNHE